MLSAALDRIKAFLFWKVSYLPDYRQDLAIIDAMAERLGTRLEPANARHCYWRSLAQYRCQATARNRWAVWFANLVGLAMLPGFLVFLREPRCGARRRATYLKIDFHPAYLVPTAIRDATLEWSTTTSYLRIEDLIFPFRAFGPRVLLNPELLAKFYFWVRHCRPNLDQVDCQYLIQYCEFSAHSSLRKAYLNAKGIRLANITHGEEILSCRNAFSICDRYFAWRITPGSLHKRIHIRYDDLFHFDPCEDLPRAPKPDSLRRIGVLWPSTGDVDLHAFTQMINDLSNTFEVTVRPHPNPRYRMNLERHAADLQATISDPAKEDIHTFVDRHDCIAGFMSAALLQAVFRGRQVIYLQDSFLEALREYHDFYRQVACVSVDQLGAHLRMTRAKEAERGG